LAGKGAVFRAGQGLAARLYAGQQTATQRRQEEAVQARADKQRIRELERELRRKEKALAETAAPLVLRKKLNAPGETTPGAIDPGPGAAITPHPLRGPGATALR
jgi:hypothetical protein